MDVRARRRAASGRAYPERFEPEAQDSGLPLSVPPLVEPSALGRRWCSQRWESEPEGRVFYPQGKLLTCGALGGALCLLAMHGEGCYAG